MKEDRDIELMALSLATGIFLAGLIPLDFIYFSASSAQIATISLCLTLTSARTRWAFAFLIFFLGLFIGANGQILSLTETFSSGFLTSVALKAGTLMQEAIDSIPFSCPESNAVVKALLTGNRADLPAEVTESFRTSGASHILALSGLHLGIIYGIINALLKVFGNTTAAVRIRSVASVLICGTYTLATGAGASLVRAFIFICVRETAKITGREVSLGRTLSVSAIIQLCICPEDLRSVGFQLSYAAIAGIAYIYPVIRDLWKTEEGQKGAMVRLWQSAALSISCQITTGPLAYIYFQTFPTYFILTNLIALPLTGIIIPLSVLTLCLSGVGFCPEFVIRVTEMVVTALCDSLEIIASMPDNLGL